MKQEYFDAWNQLLLLKGKLENVDVREAMFSLDRLMTEAGNNNQEAKDALSELSNRFLDLHVSFRNLVSFIDKRFSP